MIDTILNCIASLISLIVFFLIYVFAIAKPLPYFLLSPSYKKHIGSDREVRKYKFPNGRGIVYEPSDDYKSYLEQYILFIYNDQKYIKCKLSGNVTSLRYEIAVYNEKNKLIKVLELAENIIEEKETQIVCLPANTAYVSVVLKSVNEKETFFTLRRTSIVKVCAFSIITITLTMTLGIFTRLAITNVFALLNNPISIALGTNLISSFIVGTLVAYLCLVIYKKQVFGEK